MSDKKMTLGQSIDQVISALEPLDKGARQTAINAACEHLGIIPPNVAERTPPLNAPLTNTQTPLISPVPTPPSKKPIDIRTLKEEKSPVSASQMACVVAYYLQELAPEKDRKNTVNAKDLEKYFKQAKFDLPKTISQLLPDSRAAGYFDSATGRGEYSLNAVGYNLVAHNLPKKVSK